MISDVVEEQTLFIIRIKRFYFVLITWLCYPGEGYLSLINQLLDLSR